MAKKRAASLGTMISQSRGVSPSEKAAFHNISGAGKSRVIREFFGLTPSDEEAITTLVERDLDARLGGSHV